MTNTRIQEVEFSNGYTVLMLKSEEGDLDQIKKILTEKHESNINAVNRNGYTALSLAVKGGYYRIASALLEAGADLNIKNNSGQSPLFLACWNNFKDIVYLLLEKGAEINTKDQRGWTPLMIAAYNGHKDLVRALLEKNADPLIKDCFEKTALDRTKDPLISKLLQKAMKSPAYKDSNPEQSRDHYRSNSFQESSVSKDIPNSILKKYMLRGEGEYSKYDEMENILPSTKHREYMSPQHERRIKSPPKHEFMSPQNHSYHLSYLGSRKGSDPKIATRFNRIQGERSNNSFERSFRTSSKSPRSVLASQRQRKTSSSLQRDTRTPVVSLSEVKKAALKEDLQNDLSHQVEDSLGKIQDVVLQRIALEIPTHMQGFEQNLKKELNSVFRFRMDSIFKSLHASLNVRLKFCLNKLGYDTTAIDLTPFTEEELPQASITKLFTSPVPKYNYQKEVKALEKDISRLERSLSPSKRVHTIDKSLHSELGCREHACEHIPFSYKNELKNELFDQLGQEVRSTTEHLMEVSSVKLNDLVRGETHQVHQKMMAELNRNIDVVEEEFKKTFEDLINQKINDLIRALGGSAPQSKLTTSNNPRLSPQVTPSKQLYSTATRGSENKTKVEKELDFASSKEVRSENIKETDKTSTKYTESYGSPQLYSPTRKEREEGFSQTKKKIEKLKNSLNFIDETKPPLSERTEENIRERDSQRKSRKEFQYEQEESTFPESAKNGRSKGITFGEQSDFMNSIKKEFTENIQAASKLEELKNFYQQRYGNLSIPKTEPRDENFKRFSSSASSFK